MASTLQAAEKQDLDVVLCRCFVWTTIALIAAFLVNNYLTVWQSWPSVWQYAQGSILAIVQLAIYVLGIGLALYFVLSTNTRALRPDSYIIYSITNYIIRAAFWGVLLVGLCDMVVSFLRVEGLLAAVVGEEISSGLNRSEYRGIYLHFPVFILGLIIAAIHRGLGFTWLALMVVIAELLIVLTRFIFSYEQAFMGDLVRFWYAALFLFASAYTLYEEGHVRVDVVYSALSTRTKGLLNAIGCVLLGMSLCWVIIYFGMANKSSIINNPILNYEVTQTGFGMFVKYWMAGFLGVFAVSMLLQFSGYFLESIADFRGDPDKRLVNTEHSDHA